MQCICISGVAARVFEWGGQKFDKIFNLSHYAWMTDKIVRPKELLIPPKTVLYTSNYEQKFYKYILTKNSKIQMRKFHLSKKWGGQGPPGPPVAATAGICVYAGMQLCMQVFMHES